MGIQEKIVHAQRSVSLLSLAFLPVQGRVQHLYGALAENNSLCSEKLYLNLGYWGYGAKTIDEAAEGMARLLAEAAALNDKDEVLDIGFGFGDQDFFWLDNYRPKKITGINITHSQVQAAKKSAINRGCKTVEFKIGDGTKVDLESNSVDVVFALESAFHFNTREDFFKEAFRVLRPGGRLAIADLTSVDHPLKIKDKIAGFFGRSFWQIPKANLYPLQTYSEKIIKAGFKLKEARSIWQDVYPPFVKYARQRLRDQSLAHRMNPAFRKMLQMSLSARDKLHPEAMDYILVVASKPV